jgi:hypothetical protein
MRKYNYDAINVLVFLNRQAIFISKQITVLFKVYILLKLHLYRFQNAH